MSLDTLESLCLCNKTDFKLIHNMINEARKDDNKRLVDIYNILVKKIYDEYKLQYFM